MDKCFACDKPLKTQQHIVHCADDQWAYVGPDCFKRVVQAGQSGYQPPLGGPKLYAEKPNGQAIQW